MTAPVRDRIGGNRGPVFAAVCLAFSCSLACTDRIAVLDAKRPSERSDGGAGRGGGGDATESPRDAGGPPSGAPRAGSGSTGASGGSGSAGDATGSVTTGKTDAGEPPVQPPSCDLPCGPSELCTWDRCVPAQGVMSLSAWLGHSCAVEAGRLFCWGSNDQGQLGVGDRNERDRKTRVGNANDWLAVATGEHFSCGIRAPGQLYCWGANEVGELGLGDTNPRLEPSAVPGADHVAQIAAGGQSACALDVAGALYCWGDNLEGKPGQDDPFSAPDVLSPARVGSDRWQLVTVGQGHVCGVRGDDRALCWGRNTPDNLELGIGGPDPGQARAPLEIMFQGRFTSMSASQHHTCGVRDDGTLWCWGGNAHSELAVPSADRANSGVPLQVGGDTDWAETSVGWFHSCARKQDGRVFCWGRAIEGQLGVESIDPIPTLTQLQPPASWLEIATGSFFTCAVDGANAIYCTGANDRGQLGLGDLDRRHAPTALP